MKASELKCLSASMVLGGSHTTITPEKEAITGGIRAAVYEERSGECYSYRKMTLTNVGDEKSAQITCPYVLDAKIPCTAPAALHTLRGDDCSKDSFFPIDKTICEGDTVTFIPTGGRPSNVTAFPIMDLTFEGFTLLLAIGWSGQWKCELKYEGGALRVTVGLENADFYLKPGETVKLPSLLLLVERDGVSARRAFRNLLTIDFSPLPRSYNSDHLPMSIQPFDRYFWQRLRGWVSEEGQLETLRGAQKCGGFDTLWIDAAWFRDGFPSGVGNYEFTPEFPRGLRPVADAVHEAGMRFMVWFEPERIAKGSDIYYNQREYYLCKSDDFEHEDTFLYNLGDEAAWQWLYNVLSNFIRDNGIDNYRQDFNMDPLAYWLHNDKEGRTGITEIRYIDGFYRLWDSLRAEFPQLFIDNCASGGRRLEFETLRRAAPMWRSDLTCAPITPDRPSDVYNQNLTLVMSEYLPYHACAAWEPIANEVRSVATAGLACEFDVLNPDFDYAPAKFLLEEANRLASLWSGDFYPLTEASLSLEVFAAFQLAKENEGYAAIFRRKRCEADEFALKLRAIDEGADYILSLTDEKLDITTKKVSGALLARGIFVTLPEPHTSLIVEYKKI